MKAPARRGRQGRRTLLDSVRDGAAGFLDTLRTERNMRIHLAAAAVVSGGAALLGVDPVGWALLSMAIGGVVAAELLNTGVETVVDFMTDKRHPLARRAKDVAAGAVLVQSVVAVAVGGFVFSAYVPKAAAWLPFVLWGLVTAFGLFQAHKEVRSDGGRPFRKR